MRKGEKMLPEQKKIMKEKIAAGKAAAKEKREAAAIALEEKLAKKAEKEEAATGSNLNEMKEPYEYVEPEKKIELPKARVPSGEIQFFTEEDYNPKGKVANDFPAYYFRKELKELMENAQTQTRNIELGVFTGKRLEDAKDHLKAMNTKIDKIVNGRPKLSGNQKDKFARSFKDLHERIKDTRFKYDEMWKQTVDAQDEADRMEGHCVKIPDEIVASYVRQKGYPVKNGKITRNAAHIICKVMGNILEHQVQCDYKDQ